jgi:hypothetical protein
MMITSLGYDNDLQWFCVPMNITKNDIKDIYKFLRSQYGFWSIIKI